MMLGRRMTPGREVEPGAHQRFGFGLGLLVGVAVALADGELIFADEAGAFAGDVGGADVGEAAQVGRGGGEVEYAAGAFDVDVAGFFERVVEADCGGAMDDAGDFSREALEAGGVEAAVGEAYVAGVDLDAGLVCQRDELIGARLGRFLRGALYDSKNL